MACSVFTLGAEDVAVLQLHVLAGVRKTAYDLIASAHF